MSTPTHKSVSPPKRVSGKFVVMVLIVVPVLALAWLMYVVGVSLDAGTQLAAPAKGAGAGDTGGANAIGEMLAKPK